MLVIESLKNNLFEEKDKVQSHRGKKGCDLFSSGHKLREMVKLLRIGQILKWKMHVLDWLDRSEAKTRHKNH